MSNRASNGMQRSLGRMAESDPELAARLLLQALPAAGAPLNGRLDYRLVLEDVGTYRVSLGEGGTGVEPTVDGADGVGDFELHTDAASFAHLAAGASPLRLMLTGRVRIRGKRRRALKLRKLAGDLTIRD